MNIVSWNFLLFIVVVLAGYYLLARRAQNVWLLLASYVFYITWNWHYALVLLVFSTINFFLARELTADKPRRRLWLWLGITLNLLSLAVLKVDDSAYAVNFLHGLLPAVDGVFARLVLPIGFSFYVLQAISYLVDVSQKRLAPATDWIDFALYLAYFPKLISGPIERARSFLPRLAQKRVVTNDTLARAVTLILVGLVRKLVVADVLYGLLPEKLFANPELTWPVRVVGLLGYAFYLYNDFAGYTSIARGVSLLFGIELSPNFQQPYFARNFTEFWNRWHISLSAWLRDYIFFPFSRWLMQASKGQRNAVNVVLPPLVTMVASGLWHGFFPAMVLWGFLHGVYQVIERVLLLRWPRLRPQDQPRWLQGVSMLLTFVLAVLAWVPFGALDFRGSFVFWQALFSGAPAGVLAAPQITTLAFVLFALVLDVLQERGKGGELVFLHWPQTAQAGLIVAAVLLLVIVGFWNSGLNAPVFVYQGF